MISRRALLQGVAGAAAVAAVGSATAFALPAGALRPPGAQDDDRFWGACIRCDRCRSVCPTSAIGVAKLEEGLLAARTPRMEFRLGYCDACGGTYRCIGACPTGALQPFDPDSDKIGMAVIDREKCETFGVSAACNAECVSACPTEALALDDEGRLGIDEEACWGCGACEFACPSNAYRTYDGSTRRGINIELWKGRDS